MEVIDKIIFGDNQFFGINHMSQEKAQQLAEQFFDINNIYKVYQMAFDSGIRAIMLNSNDRAAEICNHFRSKPEYADIAFYPSIPYPHKYANLITEKGILPAINSIVFKENSAKNIFGMMAQGGMAVISKDAISLMKMLVDIEMKMFRGLNVKVVFLQNIVTDLILGLDVKEVFYEYCKHIRKKYNAIPGLITQNLPELRRKFMEWGIDEVVICSSFNKIGYLMSPNVQAYIDVAKENDPKKYQLMAMSTLASGAISPKAAYDFINAQNIQSVVFGASSKKHIEETVSLIKL
jgi:hypothetical protein